MTIDLNWNELFYNFSFPSAWSHAYCHDTITVMMTKIFSRRGSWSRNQDGRHSKSFEAHPLSFLVDFDKCLFSYVFFATIKELNKSSYRSNWHSQMSRMLNIRVKIENNAINVNLQMNIMINLLFGTRGLDQNQTNFQGSKVGRYRSTERKHEKWRPMSSWCSR